MKFAVIGFLLFTMPLPAMAVEVTLRDALLAAVAERPQAQAAWAVADAAKADIGLARGNWLPRVTVSEWYARTNEPAGSLFLALNQERNVMADPTYNLVEPNSQDDFETRLQLTQTLYDPVVDFGLRRARTIGEAALADAAWIAEETAFAAFRAYLDVQQTMAAMAWVENSLREATEVARLTEERYRAGTGLKADALRAGVQLAEARRRELAARNDLTLARRRLALAMGRPAGEVGIAAPLDEQLFPPPPADRADDRDDLRAMALQSEAAGLAVRQSRAEWLPRLGLTARYAWHDGQTPFGTESGAWAVGAGLEWELFDGLRREFAAAKAAAEQRTTAARLAEARREQQFSLAEARLRAEEARLQRDSARQAVAAAEESRRLLQERFTAGLADLGDLLAAQSALDRARFDAVGAENRLFLALGNIHFQAGRFRQAFLPDEELRR